MSLSSLLRSAGQSATPIAAPPPLQQSVELRHESRLARDGEPYGGRIVVLGDACLEPATVDSLQRELTAKVDEITSVVIAPRAVFYSLALPGKKGYGSDKSAVEAVRREIDSIVMMASSAVITVGGHY